MPVMPPVGRRPRRPSTIRPKRTYARQLTLPRRREPRLRGHVAVGTLLLAVALVLVVTHQMEHADVLDPLPGNLEDLLLGFPMAGVFGMAAFVAFIWK